MLATTVALHDVADVAGFVAATISRAGITAAAAEHEELMLEGLAILYTLAAAYKPRLDGYAQDGRFSGFAARYLPRKLGDAWHRLHPEHRYVTDPATGKRGWRYGKPTISLDALTEGDDAHALDHALHTARRPHEFVPIALSTQAA